MHNSAPFPFSPKLRLWFTSGPSPQVRFPNTLALFSTQWWDLKLKPRHFSRPIPNHFFRDSIFRYIQLQRLFLFLSGSGTFFRFTHIFWKSHETETSNFACQSRNRTTFPSSVCAAEVEESLEQCVAPSGDNLLFLQHQTQHSASPSKFSKNNFNFVHNPIEDSWRDNIHSLSI